MDAKVIKFGNRGQTTIFIIIGIMIIIGIILYFVLTNGIKIPSISNRDINPNIFLTTCIEDKVQETANIISMNGGYVEPKFAKNFSFDKEGYRNISYLCYNQNFYLPCINQEPMLISHIKEEIKNEIKEDVEACYRSLISNLKENNYEIKSEYRGFNVELGPKRIKVIIDVDISMLREGVNSKQTDFVVQVNNNLYDLAIIAQEIVSQEAEYCNFETQGFMILNPEFKVQRFNTGDLETIYRIELRKSGEEFRFAVRGCVIPPGL